MSIQETPGDKKKNPRTTSAIHDQMQPRIDLVNVLLGGTEALRLQAKTYLPKHEAESELNYQSRLDRAVCTNYFQRTIESLTGKPFATPMILSEDMPPAISDLVVDIDHQGNNLDVFCRKVFRDGLAKGLTHILVEFPDTENLGVQTLEDEVQINATPYFVHIPPENIIAAYAEYRNGAEFLTHVRILESEIIQDGFSEVTIEHIRVLEPGSWTLYRKGDNDKWQLESSGKTTLDFIPLVTFYSKREDFMLAMPPLMDLAYMNVAHWQSSSDQRNALTVARYPILAASGVDETEANIKIGPKQLLTASNADARYYFVEHSGASINAGRQDLEDMKDEMSILGIELLKKSGNPTATAKAIDTAENMSMLQALVLVFCNAIDRCFKIAAGWVNLDNGGSVHIDSDFGLKLNDSGDLLALQWARQFAEISHEAYLLELKRRGTLSEDFDPVKDQKHIEEEKTRNTAEAVFQQGLVNDGSLPGAMSGEAAAQPPVQQ